MISKIFRYIFGFGVLCGVGVVIFVINLYFEIRFDAYKIIDYSPKLTSRIYDRNGDLIANIFDEEHRLYVNYEDIPPRIIEALIAVEDTVFFEHKGVNFGAILRALIKDIKAMAMVEGASTITQQLVKNTALTREKKIIRKLKEAILSFTIETQLTKEEIMERYLNHVYFGHGYYGIRTAALGYFHKQLDELTLREISYLVGLPKAPSTYNPTRNFKLATGRANRVLSRMKTVGWIDDDEFNKAMSEEPKFYDETLTQNKAPYVVDEFLKQYEKKINDLKTGGYKVHLSVDLKLQELAKQSVKHGYDLALMRYKKWYNDVNGTKGLNGGLVSIDNKSGDILAMVGGVDYKESNFNRVTQSLRQPGSAIKPFIYQEALNVGYSTLSEIPDISRVYKNGSAKDWKPKNYHDEFKGLITLKTALTKSSNLATINLVSALGLDSVYKALSNYGFKGVPYDLTISLGSFGVSPLEFSQYWSVFANYGTMVKPVLVKKIVTKEGALYGDESDYESKKREMFDKRQTFLLVDILHNVVKNGTGKKAAVKDIDIAGKTGTTNNNVDAWFCGFTPEIEVIAWYGKDDNTPMQKYETGGQVAAPAFQKFVQGYVKLYPQTKRYFLPPAGVYSRKINGVEEYFTNKSPLINKSNSATSSSDELLF